MLREGIDGCFKWKFQHNFEKNLNTLLWALGQKLWLRLDKLRRLINSNIWNTFWRASVQIFGDRNKNKRRRRVTGMLNFVLWSRNVIKRTKKLFTKPFSAALYYIFIFILYYIVQQHGH